MKSYYIGVGPMSRDRCPYEKREIWTLRHTEWRMQSEGGGRHRGDAPVSEKDQGTPGAAETERGRKVPPLEPSEGVQPYQQLDFRLLTSRE